MIQTAEESEKKYGDVNMGDEGSENGEGRFVITEGCNQRDSTANLQDHLTTANDREVDEHQNITYVQEGVVDVSNYSQSNTGDGEVRNYISPDASHMEEVMTDQQLFMEGVFLDYIGGHCSTRMRHQVKYTILVICEEMGLYSRARNYAYFEDDSACLNKGVFECKRVN